MDIRSRLELAGRALFALLDPEHDLLPTGGYEVAHDLGRWWDAVLRLEATVGWKVPAALESASTRNLRRLTDNPDCLLMNRPDISWLRDRARINPHNFRESILAFSALRRHRQAGWAERAALRLVQSMDRCLRDDGSLDFAKLGSWGIAPLTDDPSHAEAKRNGWFDGTATSGRSIEALIWLYESTGAAPALDLAGRLAEHHFEHTLSPDGTIRPEILDPQNVGHNHSYHGTLRGLLLYGLASRRRAFVDAVAATYRNTRETLVMESGWAPHDLGIIRFSNAHGDPVADPASAGDAAQLALWLALNAGHDDLLDDVERLVRARLLPAQMTASDGEATERETGAWCIHGPSHGGKGCTPDVLAAVTHSLSDVYRHVCTVTAELIRVNLHLEYEDALITVRSQRDTQGELRVTLRTPADLSLRIPGWVDAASVDVRVDGRASKRRCSGSWMHVDAEALGDGREVVMTYALPERSTEECMPSGRIYRFRWCGDHIVGVAPQDSPRPFYPQLGDVS